MFVYYYICRITYSLYLYSSFIRLFKKKSFCLFLIFEYFCEKFACMHSSSYFLKKNPSKLCILPYYTMNISIMLQQFDRGLFLGSYYPLIKKFVGTTLPNSLYWNSSKLYIAMNACLLPYECLHIFMAVLLDHFVSNYCPFSLNIPTNELMIYNKVDIIISLKCNLLLP